MWVQSLVWEEPRCRRATRPMCFNYWVHALKPASHSYWACVPQVLRPACLEPVLHKKRSHHNEGPKHHKWRAIPCSPQPEKGPSSSEDRTAKNKHFFFKDAYVLCKDSAFLNKQDIFRWWTGSRGYVWIQAISERKKNMQAGTIKYITLLNRPLIFSIIWFLDLNGISLILFNSS